MYSVQECYNMPVYQKTCEEPFVTKEKAEDKNLFQCSTCGLIICNKWNFTLHMRVHNNDRRYKCTSCSSSFITSYDLKRHTLIHSGDKPRFKCQFCPKTYASRHSRYLHEDTHDKVKHKCRHCPQVFSKFMDRKRHEKDSHHNINSFFNCSECNKKFTSRRFLENHEKSYHRKEQDGFKCEECCLVFKTYATLNIHRRTHVNTTIVISQTDISGSQNSEVRRLKKKVPIEVFGVRIHECIICTKRFASRSDMLTHMSLSHPKENKEIFRFPCNLCDKSFKTKQSLSQHLVTHVGEKRFSCSQCDYKSKRNADLKVHMRKHTGEAPYICNKCGQRFQQVKSFQHHKKQHYGKLFKCTLCESSFYRSKELDWHRQKHSSGGFKCHKCNKLLANPYSLKSHLKTRKCADKDKEPVPDMSQFKRKLGENIIELKTMETRCYECFACGFSTLSYLDIVRHQQLHNSPDKELATNDKRDHPVEELDINSSRLKHFENILKFPSEKTKYKGTISFSKFSKDPVLSGSDTLLYL